MFNQLLVPSDGSELSLAAARRAFELARPLQARITAVVVLEPYPYTGIGQASPGDLQNHLTAQRQMAEGTFAAMEAMAKENGVPLHTVMAEDREAAQGIVDAAADGGADLIVMASRGRTGLAKLMLGSVAAKVLELSRVPVLIVK